MAKVVFQVVALIFEHIDVLIFDFPTGTAHAGNHSNIGNRKRMIGDPSIVVDGITGLGMRDV